MKLIWLANALLLILSSCNMGNDPSGIHPGSSNSSRTKGKAQIIKFDIIKGQQYFDSDAVDVRINYESNEFTILLTGKINDSIKSIKSQPGFEIMNSLLTTVTASTKTKKAFAIKQDVHYLSEAKITHQAKFSLADFHMLPAGANSIRLDINCTVVSHDEDNEKPDVLSQVKPFSVSVLFQFNIPSIHKSTIHFKSIKLNASESDAYLKKNGNNDFLNATPEAGVKIFYKDNLLFKDFTENSYTHDKAEDIEFYHVGNTETITIKAIDADYGFNIDDYISHTEMSIEKLLLPSHENFPFKRVDEFWVYCTTDGRIN